MELHPPTVTIIWKSYKPIKLSDCHLNYSGSMNRLDCMERSGRGIHSYCIQIKEEISQDPRQEADTGNEGIGTQGPILQILACPSTTITRHTLNSNFRSKHFTYYKAHVNLAIKFFILN